MEVHMRTTLETIQSAHEMMILRRHVVRKGSEDLLNQQPDTVEELSAQGANPRAFVYGADDPDTSGTYIP